MNLKQKSITISISMVVVAVIGASFVIYQILMVRFQEIENQRVERNIRRISAIVDDRFNQLKLKLSDWTIWDDTYQYLNDGNRTYAESNLSEASFESIGVDEVLFIKKSGEVMKHVRVSKKYLNGELDDVAQHFATGSALLKIDDPKGSKQGVLKVKDGLLLFMVQNVFKSDGSGDPNGYMVFGRYFDDSLINAMKDLTQFEAQIELWDDPKIGSDYLVVKNKYISSGEKSVVRIFDDKTISGYLVIEDVFGKPAAIVRSDIGRDITMQGKIGMNILIGVMVLVVVSMMGVNYLLFTKEVLGKVLSVARDVDNLKNKKEGERRRLEVGKTVDEVDKLRAEINEMLGSIEEEKHKGDTLIDFVSALVVMLNTNGEVMIINKRGLEMLGYSKEEVIGKNWIFTFVPEENREKVSAVFSGLMNGNEIDNSAIESWVLTKDNRVLLMSWHNTVIKDGEGKITSTLSLGEDITVRKEEEMKKEEYGKELERLNGAMVGRELKMVELKNEINRLKAKINS